MPLGRQPQSNGKTEHFAALAEGGVVVVASMLMVLQAQAVFINVGGLSLSVYGLVLTAGLLSLAFFARIMPVFLRGEEPIVRRAILAKLMTFGALLSLSVYATIRLALDWRLEGAQNLLALYVLTLGPLVFWLSQSWPTPEELLRIFSWIMGPTAMVYIAFRLSDLPGFADRQFAMVALIGLSVAVSRAPANRFERLFPYLIFIGIILSGSRTASVIAVILLATIALRSTGTPGSRTLKFLGLVIGGFSMGALAYVLQGAVHERIAERGEGGTVVEVLSNSNGRLGAWAEFINLLETPGHWILGRGTGAAMEFGTANLAFFAHPHNEYIRYLVDLGLFGITLLALGFVSVFGALLRKKGFFADAPRAASLVLFALAGMSVTDGPLYSSFVIIPAALVVGSGLRATETRHVNSK